MKECPNCNAQMDDDDVFCTVCGQSLPDETTSNRAKSSKNDSAQQQENKKQDNSLIGCAVIALFILWLLVKGCGAIFSDEFDDKEPKGNNTAGAYEVCEFKCNYCGKEIIIDQYANLDRNGDVIGGMPYPPRTEVCPKSKVASRAHVWQMKRSKVYINRDGRGNWKRMGK